MHTLAKRFKKILPTIGAWLAVVLVAAPFVHDWLVVNAQAAKTAAAQAAAAAPAPCAGHKAG